MTMTHAVLERPHIQHGNNNPRGSVATAEMGLSEEALIADELLRSPDGRTKQDRQIERAVLGRCALEAQFKEWEVQNPNIVRGSE